MAASVDARMVAWVDGESINAGGLRLGQAASSMGGATALASRGGVRPSGGGPGLIAALPTPGMKVRVTPGIFVVPSASPTGGEYRIALETQTDLDIDNSGSFPRTDLVIAEVVDTGTSAATAKVRVLKGATDSPGAARPTNTTPNAHYVVIGSVDVRVGAESGGNIRAQDVHPERAWAVSAGGIVPVETVTEMEALPKWAGLYADVAATKQVYRCDGTAWELTAGPQTRFWYAERPLVNETDSFAANAYTPLVGLSIPDAPAGQYLLTTNLSLASSGECIGKLRVLAPGTFNLSNDIRADLRTLVRVVPFSRPFAFTGGTLTVDVQFQTTALDGTIYNRGSAVSVAYLGPA